MQCPSARLRWKGTGGTPASICTLQIARVTPGTRFGWGKAVRLLSGPGFDSTFGSLLSSKVVDCGHCLVTVSLIVIETLKWLSSMSGVTVVVRV